MKSLNCIFSLILFAFPYSPLFAETERDWSQLEKNDSSTKDWAENSPELGLENTEIGQAVKNESIKDYKKALKKLKALKQQKSLSNKEIHKILMAEDQQGNNLFHLMTQVQKSQKKFAGEALYLAVSLMGTGIDPLELLQKDNKDDLQPREIARKNENSTALSYLTEAENMIKRLKLNPGTTNDFYSLEELLGGMLFTSGGITFLMGAINGDLLTSTAGVVQGLVGGGACYLSFKQRKIKSKNKLNDNS